MSNKIILFLRDKVWMSLLFFLIAGSILAFASYFLFKEIGRDSKEILFYKTKLAQLEEEANEIEKFRLKKEEYLPNLLKIQKMFVDLGDPLDFIKFLERTSQEENLNLEIAPLFPFKKENYNGLTTKLTLKGDYVNILNFLEKIEKGPHLILVDEVGIFPNKEDKKELEAIINLIVLSK